MEELRRTRNAVGGCSVGTIVGDTRLLVGKVGEERDGVAPKCHCGVYSILYRSKTLGNLNRMFFGCPFFKVSIPHYCKYILPLA
ncbi:hypothetical protein PIB30_024562 [Stylosanthes scabra]|uniref:Zinc finger GRF-type domain-containing protein n=1 Tax=Stylosanthes scabra TaxID=79078 RepID=A0ABU6SAJ0_9FABA|nr:hypothetical protein [Stylosanthes scabra]